MHSVHWTLIAVFGAGVILGAMILIVRQGELSDAANGKVRNLAQVRAMVEANPTRSFEQTVRLHAIPVRGWCFDWVVPANGTCRMSAPAFVVAEPTDGGEPLELAFGDTPLLAAQLRRIPLLDRLAHKPQIINWAKAGIYTVELKRAPCISGEPRPCFSAVVLDVGQS